MSTEPNASLYADQTRSQGEQVQQAAEEYSAITAELSGVKGMKVIPGELTPLGQKMRTGINSISQSNASTNNSLEAAKGTFWAANPQFKK